MVKGVARRVIMVNSPDPKLFEQAIFLVREEAFRNGTPDQVLKEAEQIAKSCLHKQNGSPTHDIWPTVLSLFCGGGIASLIWGICVFF